MFLNVLPTFKKKTKWFHDINIMDNKYGGQETFPFRRHVVDQIADKIPMTLAWHHYYLIH